MGKEALPFIDYVPKPFRALYAISALSVLTACGQGAPVAGKERPSGNSNSSTLTTDKLLQWPLSITDKTNIQQGFTDIFDINEKGEHYKHNALDIINGEVADSADSIHWESYKVLASAAGMACEPDVKQGNAVYMEHTIAGKKVRTYYGHLKDQPILPPCSKGFENGTFYARGQVIGEAGASGVATNLVHLHWETKVVIDGQEVPIDPTDINGTRDKYPQPLKIGPKNCGPNALLAACYESGAIIALPGEPPPTPRTQTDEIKAATVAPTSKPGSTAISPTAVRQIIQPASKPIEKPIQTVTLTQEQKAQKKALEIWFADLNSVKGQLKTQTSKQADTTGRFAGRNYINTRTIQAGSPSRPLTPEAIVTGLISKDDPNNDMVIRWIMEDYMDQVEKSRYAGEYVNKWANAVGQSELARIWTSFSGGNSPTDAEQLNGLRGRGQVTIHASTRFQGVVRRTMADDANISAINRSLFDLGNKQWVDEPPKTINLDLKGDQWQFAGSDSYNPKFPLNVLFKPSNMAEPLNRIPCDPDCNISVYL